MSKCKKCGNKLLTVSTYVSEWDADQEPYESGEYEEHDGVNESVYLNACYCEKCEAFDGIYIEAATNDCIVELNGRDQRGDKLEEANAALVKRWEEFGAEIIKYVDSNGGYMISTQNVMRKMKELQAGSK